MEPDRLHPADTKLSGAGPGVTGAAARRTKWLPSPPLSPSNPDGTSDRGVPSVGPIGSLTGQVAPRPRSRSPRQTSPSSEVGVTIQEEAAVGRAEGAGPLEEGVAGSSTTMPEQSPKVGVAEDPPAAGPTRSSLGSSESESPRLVATSPRAGTASPRAPMVEGRTPCRRSDLAVSACWQVLAQPVGFALAPVCRRSRNWSLTAAWAWSQRLEGRRGCAQWVQLEES